MRQFIVLLLITINNATDAKLREKDLFFVFPHTYSQWIKWMHMHSYLQYMYTQI